MHQALSTQTQTNGDGGDDAADALAANCDLGSGGADYWGWRRDRPQVVG